MTRSAHSSLYRFAIVASAPESLGFVASLSAYHPSMYGVVFCTVTYRTLLTCRGQMRKEAHIDPGTAIGGCGVHACVCAFMQVQGLQGHADFANLWALHVSVLFSNDVEALNALDAGDVEIGCGRHPDRQEARGREELHGDWQPRVVRPVKAGVNPDMRQITVCGIQPAGDSNTWLGTEAMCCTQQGRCARDYRTFSLSCCPPGVHAPPQKRWLHLLPWVFQPVFGYMNSLSTQLCSLPTHPPTLTLAHAHTLIITALTRSGCSSSWRL